MSVERNIINTWSLPLSLSPSSLFFLFFLSFFLFWPFLQSHSPYSPPLPPPAENEYPVGAEITEATDPSREEEAAFEAAQAQAREEAEAGEEEGEEED